MNAPADLFGAPALRPQRRGAAGAPPIGPSLGPVRVVEALPLRVNRRRYARVTLDVGPLRLSVLASTERVAFPTCRGEAGVAILDPTLSAEIERVARAAARRAHR